MYSLFFSAGFLAQFIFSFFSTLENKREKINGTKRSAEKQIFIPTEFL